MQQVLRDRIDAGMRIGGVSLTFATSTLQNARPTMQLRGGERRRRLDQANRFTAEFGFDSGLTLAD